MLISPLVFTLVTLLYILSFPAQAQDNSLVFLLRVLALARVLISVDWKVLIDIARCWQKKSGLASGIGVHI
jgi:hypothetical protein